MVAYGGNTQGLFHGAIMQSGSPIPTGDITTNQPYYDAVVNETGCAGAADTLQCLRGVSFASLQAAATKSPGLFTPQVCQAVYRYILLLMTVSALVAEPGMVASCGR